MNGTDILIAMNDISDSVLEKSTQLKNRQKRILFRRPAAFAAAAAAALALTVTAGAAVYNYANSAKHTESIEQYIEGGSSLPGYEPVNVVNEHLDLTVDSLWSDGIVATAIVTVKPLDAEGETVAKKFGCHVGYADEEFDPDKWIVAGITREWATDQIDSNNLPVDFRNYDTSEGVKYRMEFVCADLDTSRNVNLYFYNEDLCGDEIKPAITAETSFEKNLRSVKLYSREGRSVILSPLGLYENTADISSQNTGVGHEATYEFVRISGKAEEEKGIVGVISSSFSADGDEAGNYTRVEFKRTIDVNDYKAVIIDGVEYARK